MSYKTTDALMQHLRDSGIMINSGEQKRQLINTGYFHGYKGYRFFGNAQRRLPFVSYDEVYATIQYDSDLKALLYGKMMYIETAVKNIALESILVNANSESIQDMYDKVVSGYNNAPIASTTEQKKLLKVSKTEIKAFIRGFEKMTDNYRQTVNPNVAAIVIHPDLAVRMNILKTFL